MSSIVPFIFCVSYLHNDFIKDEDLFDDKFFLAVLWLSNSIRIVGGFLAWSYLSMLSTTASLLLSSLGVILEILDSVDFSSYTCFDLLLDIVSEPCCLCCLASSKYGKLYLTLLISDTA